jgi:hypothetical protein
MATLIFSRSIAAGATDNPLSALGWAYETVQGFSAVRILTKTTATGVVQRVAAGTEQVQDETPVQVIATAGVQPSVFNTEPLEFIAAPGDRIGLALRNTTGGALTVDGVVKVEPLG